MDGFLNKLGGCGLFQILFSTFVVLPQLTCAFSSIFMAFGAYNPGWRCVDDDEDIGIGLNTSIPRDKNATRLFLADDHKRNSDGLEHVKALTTASPMSNYVLATFVNSNATQSLYTGDDTETMCIKFTSCQAVYFDPSTSTVAAEWGLLCEKSWILSLITSLQMVGTLIGAVIVGYLGDTFGRKRALYSGVAINAVLQIVTMQSTSWQMFAGMRLAIGISNGVITFLPTAFISELIIQKWRCVVGSLPIWILGTVIFSVAGMLINDWRLLHAFNSGLSVFCLLPVFWVPESIRWLMVQQKTGKAIKEVNRITRFNKINAVALEDFTTISNKLKLEVDRINGNSRKLMVLQLFTKNKFVISVVVGALWFTGDLVYFVTSFVVPNLPGDFFTNLILISAMDIPGNMIAAIIPNIFGRKRSLMAAFAMLSLSLFLVIAVEKGLERESYRASTIAILALTILARTSQNITYCVLVVYVNELYPTIIRSLANGYGGFTGSIGSVLAPYLLPSISGSLSVSYLILGSGALVCTFLLLLLPETKGKQMPDV